MEKLDDIVYAKRGNVMDIYTLVKSIPVGDSIIRLYTSPSLSQTRTINSDSVTSLEDKLTSLSQQRTVNSDSVTSLEDKLTPSVKEKVVENKYIDREYIIYCFNCVKYGQKPVTDLDKLLSMREIMLRNYKDYKDTEVYKLLFYVLKELGYIY